MPSLAVTPSASSTLSLSVSTTLSADQSSSTTTMMLKNRVHTPNYVKIKNDFGQLPLLYDLRIDLNHSENQIVLPAVLVKSVIDVVKEVEKQGMGGIKYCTVENPLGGVRVLTENGLDFYYDPNADIVAQINNLKNIIKTNHPKEYVDLLYGNRVYWR